MAHSDTGNAPPEAPRQKQGRRYRDLNYLSRWLIALLTLSGIIAIVAVVSDLMELDLVNRVIEGRIVLDEELLSNDERQQSIGLFQLAIGVLTALIFIAWTFVAYGNLQPLGALDLRYGRAWSIVGWVIPIANLFVPKQIINDVWRASDPKLEYSSARWKGEPVPVLITAWWALLLISGAVGRIAASGRAAIDAEEFRSSTQAFVASDALLAVTALLAILVVRMITARQQERASSITDS